MVMHRLEKTLGLPPLSEVVDTFNKLPDGKRLNAIRKILEQAEKASAIVPELDKVVSLVASINELPLEKLEKLEKILKRIEKIVEKAPDDLIKFLAELKDG